MLPHKPEDWPSLFEQHLNSGDLEAVMALYEPDARFVARSGETVGSSPWAAPTAVDEFAET